MFGEKSDFTTENKACYVILDNDPRTEYWSIIKHKEVMTFPLPETSDGTLRLSGYKKIKEFCAAAAS